MALNADDRLEIQELYARYNHALDHNRPAEWAALFTPGGRFDRPGQPEVAGRDALVAYATPRRVIRHWTNNLVIDETPAGVRASAYVIAFRLEQDERNPVMVSGIYNDELERFEGRWRFAARHVTFEFASPHLASAVATPAEASA